LLRDCPNDRGMLMPQVAALGQAAHVQVVTAVLVPEMGAASPNDGRRLPLGLDTPAMQDAFAFADRRTDLVLEIHLSLPVR